MHSTLLITDVVLTPARPADLDAGLVGFIECTACTQLRLDGIALRRAADGTYSISFPERRDSQGVKHPYMRPIDTRARADIERQIIGQLKKQGRVA